jgi:hypothetical protein
MKHLHFPVPILTHNGGLIIAAAQAHPEIAKRLTAATIAAADALCKKVTSDSTDQKTAKGQLGNLTKAQKQNLTTLHQCLAQAQKTAKLAFPGQTVLLHQSFQIGVHGKNDLGSFLDRIDTVLGAVNLAANLPALKAKGWTDDETTAFQTARDGFGPAEQYRVKSISGAKDTTLKKNQDAVTLYDAVLAIQNAADLEWPASDPANAGVRGEFLLGVFPPDHGGNHAPAPEPVPAATPVK